MISSGLASNSALSSGDSVEMRWARAHDFQASNGSDDTRSATPVKKDGWVLTISAMRSAGSSAPETNSAQASAVRSPALRIHFDA